MPRPTPLLPVLMLSLVCSLAHAHSPVEAIAEMTGAANAWLESLTPEQRASAQIDFASPERENWHYIPKPREGLSLAKMSPQQRPLARALLATGLSQHGMLQAESVVALERVLRVMEDSERRDETQYYFIVFGTPADKASWGWRIEGHHLSINFTIVDGLRVSATPNFVGANPAEVRLAGPQVGKRVLAEEEDQGRALVLSFDETKRAKAIISDRAPGDILTRNEKRPQPPEIAGLGFGAMSAAEQAAFQKLVAVYAHRLRPEIADEELKKIAAAGWDKLTFAWAGSTQPGQGHYYRIQGPAFVIEYDNTQNNANHVHTVWRIFEGDFGRDLLQEHYHSDHPAVSR